MKKLLLLLLALLLTGIMVSIMLVSKKKADDSTAVNRHTSWAIQSIDTMKYSRDTAREKITDLTFDEFIEKNVSEIAQTGATHVGVGTPYDSEFVPFLKRWVDAARRHKLNVWFRGNMSGWEGWFGYKSITRQEHTNAILTFINENERLFEDGDLFTSCPECENGGPGDPRLNGDAQGHKDFLIHEYNEVKKAFLQIDKKVMANTYSMNGDVARIIMDRQTTSSLDGVVVIDHYVATPEKIMSDVEEIANTSGGRIMLGEFGVPIPDIHGDMTQIQQHEWLTDLFIRAAASPSIIGFNYWTSRGGSTQLWDDDGTPRMAVDAVTAAYKPTFAYGVIKDEIGSRVEMAQLRIGDQLYRADESGNFQIPMQNKTHAVIVSAPEFVSQSFNIYPSQKFTITLKRTTENLWFKLRKTIFKVSPF